MVNNGNNEDQISETEELHNNAQQEKALTAVQKLEINQYVGNLIRSWLTWLGIANITVLVGSLIYIFFILPGKAVTDIKSQVTKETSNIISKLSKESSSNISNLQKESSSVIKNLQSNASKSATKLNDKLQESLITYGKISNELEKLTKEVEGVKKRIDETINTINNEAGSAGEKLKDLINETGEVKQKIDDTINALNQEANTIKEKTKNIKETIKNVNQDTVIEIGKIIKTLKGSEDIDRLYRKISHYDDELKIASEKSTLSLKKIEELKKRKNIPTSEITSYDGIWGDWHKEVNCPDGHYVCGLKVRFERKQGDGDDTALNAVRLKCCPF